MPPTLAATCTSCWRSYGNELRSEHRRRQLAVHGRIRIEYCSTYHRHHKPCRQYSETHLLRRRASGIHPYTTGRLNLPESFTGGRTYVVQYGRKLNFAAAGQQVPSLRIPAGLQSSTNLQLLASGLASNTSASIDVGNDGSVEWSDTVANNSTTDLPDLSAAFNAYWAASGAPATGTIDVPVKVTSGGAGQVLLTNLRTTSAASRLRHLYLPAQSYTKFLLDLSVGDAGQSGVTAAVDLGDNGSIDWHTPAAGPGPARWTTGDLAAALNAYLAGKSGTVDVPLRIYVSPSGSASPQRLYRGRCPAGRPGRLYTHAWLGGRRRQRRHVGSLSKRRRHGARGHDPAQQRQRRQRSPDRRLLRRRPQLGRLVSGQRLRRQPRRRRYRTRRARLEYAQLRRRHRCQGRRQSVRHHRRNQPGQQHGHAAGHGRALAPGPRGELQRHSRHRRRAAQRELYRPHDRRRHVPQLAVRGRRYRHGRQPVAHLHFHGRLHRDPQRRRARGQRLGAQDRLHHGHRPARHPHGCVQRLAHFGHRTLNGPVHRPVERHDHRPPVGLRRRPDEHAAESQPYLHQRRLLRR